MRASILVCFLAFASSTEAQVRASATPVVGPGASVCTDLDAVQVCLVRSGEDEVVTVSESRRETARYPTGRFWGAISMDIRAFRVGDLLVVATLDGVSNGLALTTWTVGVLPRGAHTPAYTFEVRELGLDGGSFFRHRARNAVWATEWRGMPDPSGQRVNGTYFVGRPFYLEAEGLVPIVGLPLRARRLLNSFSIAEGGPVDWLADHRAEALVTDPRLLDRPEVTTGRVISVDDRSGRGLWLTVETGAGDLFVLSSEWNEEALLFENLGDAETGRLWPVGYHADTLRLDGRRVRIEERNSGTVVWVVPEP